MIEGKAQGNRSNNIDIIDDVYIVAGATPGFIAMGTEIDGEGICKPYEGVLSKDFTELENNIENILHALAGK